MVRPLGEMVSSQMSQMLVVAVSWTPAETTLTLKRRGPVLLVITPPPRAYPGFWFTSSIPHRLVSSPSQYWVCKHPLGICRMSCRPGFRTLKNAAEFRLQSDDGNSRSSDFLLWDEMFVCFPQEPVCFEMEACKVEGSTELCIFPPHPLANDALVCVRIPG